MQRGILSWLPQPRALEGREHDSYFHRHLALDTQRCSNHIGAVSRPCFVESIVRIVVKTNSLPISEVLEQLWKLRSLNYAIKKCHHLSRYDHAQA